MNSLNNAELNLKTKTLFYRDDITCFQVTGKDRIDFLNRITSQKLIGLEVNSVAPGAFLNGNGTLAVLAHFWIQHERILIFCSKAKSVELISLLDRYHFGEDLKTDIFSQFSLMEIRSESLPCEGTKVAQQVEMGSEIVWVLPIESWKKNNKQVKRAFLYVDKEESRKKLISFLTQQGSSIANENDDFFWHVTFGVPRFPQEINESNIILEGPFDDYVHRNKGCYPGQEVIERIYTYGNVAKKIVPFEAVDTLKNSVNVVNLDVTLNNETVGKILTTQTYTNKLYGFAVVKRLALEKASQLHSKIDSKELEIKL